MKNIKKFEYFEAAIEKFYPNLKVLLTTALEKNTNVSINQIQISIGCGFNTGIKIKNILIELHYIDEKGFVIANVDDISKLDI